MQPMTKEDLLLEASDSVTPVDESAAQTMLAAGACVLDIREPAEFMMGHLPGAENIPRGVLEFKVDMHPVLKDRNADILIYCKNGGRSTLASHTLVRMGYSNLKMLVGGFDGWLGAVNKIEKDPSLY